MKVVLSVLALSLTGSFASMASAPIMASATSHSKSLEHKVALKARVEVTKPDLPDNFGGNSSAACASRRSLIGE